MSRPHIEGSADAIDAIVSKINAAAGLPRIDPMLTPGRVVEENLRTTRSFVEIVAHPKDKSRKAIVVDSDVLKLANNAGTVKLSAAERNELKALVQAAKELPNEYTIEVLEGGKPQDSEKEETIEAAEAVKGKENA